MGVTTFGAIYIGSYEVSLKIFELNSKKNMKTIDFVRSRVEIGKDAFHNETIGYEIVEELCDVLLRFRDIMKSYQVTDYQAFCGPVFKQVTNQLFIINQIKRRTGIRVQLLSNSEHRFLSYKCVTSKPEFSRMIEESAAVINVGGSDLQITLFVHGQVVTTQHLVLGTMRMAQIFGNMNENLETTKHLMQEMVDKEMEVFLAQYCQNRTLKYLIFMGDYSVELMQHMENDMENHTIDAHKFISHVDKLRKKDISQVAELLGVTNEKDAIFIPSLMLYSRIVENLTADYIWVPGVDISDGIGYDYALQNKLLKPTHDYDMDVLSAATSLSRRYMSYSPHIDALVEMSGLIFDSMKKIHGMGKREKLLVQVAAILHDCGKYISFANAPQCAYDIICSSEILGLSHNERLIVASIVKYNTYPLERYEDVKDTLDTESFLVVAKCASILRVANAMDRSHKQKYKNVRAVVKDRQLIISVEADDRMLLEKQLFAEKAGMFEQVFSIKPVIKLKKTI